MTRDEAIEVLRILVKADHGCHDCAAELVLRFVERWPEFSGEARAVYLEAFPGREGQLEIARNALETEREELEEG